MKLKRHLPNLLSLLRIFITPLIVGLLVLHKESAAIIIGLFIFAIFTDFYDGYFARKHSITSDTGNFLDPLADKFLVVSLFLVFWYYGYVPSWVLSVFVGREFFVTWLRSYLEESGQVMKTSMFGKWKTVFQFIALGLLLVVYLQVVFVSTWLLNLALYAACAMTFFSGLHYFYVNRKYLW